MCHCSLVSDFDIRLLEITDFLFMFLYLFYMVVWASKWRIVQKEQENMINILVIELLSVFQLMTERLKPVLF